MTWSRETWAQKREVGRKRFVRRTAIEWYIPMFLVLTALSLVPYGDDLTLGRVLWVLLVMVTLLPLGAWALGRFLWWDMERRYPDLGPPT